MQSLYSNGFEIIYDEMYQTFIDYKDEYYFYSTILKNQNKGEVLEIGSGTGNLAKHFIENQFDYQGMDFSEDMLRLAKSKHPEGRFIHGDMKNFKLNDPVESIIITGRTSSYLLNNKDVHSALRSMHTNLKDAGILCFDFIDANRFFKFIKGGKQLTHSSEFNGKHYYRDSYFNTNTSENFMFNWDSKYYELKDKDSQLIAEDNSEVRAFTKNEWEIFLLLNNFKLLEFIDRSAYTFDTYVVIAEKV